MSSRYLHTSKMLDRYTLIDEMMVLLFKIGVAKDNDIQASLRMLGYWSQRHHKVVDNIYTNMSKKRDDSFSNLKEDVKKS